MELLATISTVRVMRVLLATALLAGSRFHFVRGRSGWALAYFALAVFNIAAALGE